MFIRERAFFKNFRDIRDPELLNQFEAMRQADAFGSLSIGPCLVMSGAFDTKHLQAIHWHIFQDVYSWAGEVRTVNISKSGDFFGLNQYIVSTLDKTFADLQRERYLGRLSLLTAFCNRAAHYFGEINAIHPFREGNGRTQREFIRQLALRNGWSLARTTR